jgi:hypothetical protein
MLKEEKIREMIEEELTWLERFAGTLKTNIYKNDIVDVDRKIYAMSALFEVLEEEPDENVKYIINVIKDKLA